MTAHRHVATGALAVFLLGVPRYAATQQPCPQSLLPVYAHNDYLNPRPLLEALDLRLSGVEADVFLVRGTLRLGHDRNQAAMGPALATAYLAPLKALLQRCHVLTTNGRRFLFTIEIKEKSRETFDSLAALLSRYPEITRRDAMRVVLVGWHPSTTELVRSHFNSAQIQVPLRTGSPPAALDTLVVGLVSLDYGKTLGRWWRTPAGRRKWLAAIREQKRREPAIPIRVYHVPDRADVYQELLDAGVDLIGLKNLSLTSELLAALFVSRPRAR